MRLGRFVHRVPGWFWGPWGVVALTFTGLLLRLALAFLPGHNVDIGCFTAWSRDLYALGFAEFFREDYFCDYPPFYLYVLWLVGWVNSFFAPEAAPILVKLPPIIADLVLALLLWCVAGESFSSRARTVIFALLMLYPPFLLNGAVWGQVDSLTAVLCLACAMYLRQGRLLLAGALFGAAMSLKPQAFSTAGMFVPVFVAAWASGRVGRIPGAVGLAMMVFVFLAMPFADGRGIMPVLERYVGMYGTYSSASFNAPNFLAGLGGNLLSEEAVVAGLSLAMWSKLTLGLALGAGLAVALHGRRGRLPDPLLAGAYCSLVFFFFASRMHERYSFLALVFLLAAWLVSRDWRLLVAHLVLVATFFLNVGQVYVMSLERNYHIPSSDPLLLMLSWLNWIPVGLCAWTLFDPRPGRWAGRVLVRQRRQLSAAEIRERWILTAALCALLSASGVLFLWRLGSPVAPVTQWLAAEYPTVTVDFGRVVKLGVVKVFPGPVHDSSFNLETSEDGRSYVHRLFINQPSAFKWHEEHLTAPARFVRIKARNPQTVLMEVAFFDQLGNPVLAQRVEPAEAASLTDEPHTAPAFSTSYNSTFFDEIYFARTAYEHLYELPIYENTHPPLGKVMISTGIAVLGLSPFAWRLPVALMGMMSGVLAFMLARAVFRSKGAGLLTGLLFGLDGLLISQSRIATVDAMITAFTLAAFCFGWWFYRTHLRDGWRKSWWKLTLAWVFFGCAGATKWNGFFSGPALLLVTSAPWLERLLKADAGGFKNVRWWPCAVMPVLAALVITPVVYFGSYVFVLSERQSRDWAWVFEQPQVIFSYHAGGSLEHPYSSPWWTWPLTLKSIWQATDNLPQDGVTMERVSLGNPLLYWMALPCFVVFVVVALRRMLVQRDVDFFLIVAAVFSCLAPWMFVKRSTFLYHFLPALPFYVMSVTAVVWLISDRFTRRALAAKVGSVILIVSLVGVLLFYPVQAGVATQAEYRRMIQWLPAQAGHEKWLGWVWRN